MQNSPEKKETPVVKVDFGLNEDRKSSGSPDDALFKTPPDGMSEDENAKDSHSSQEL